MEHKMRMMKKETAKHLVEKPYINNARRINPFPGADREAAGIWKGKPANIREFGPGWLRDKLGKIR